MSGNLLASLRHCVKIQRMKEKPHHFVRFLGYVRPYARYVFLAVLGGIVKFTVPLFVPQITRYLLDNVYLNPALTTPQKMHELYLYAGGMMAVFVFFWAPWTYVRHYYAGKAGQRTMLDLRCELYDRILRMSASFFGRNQSSSIVARLISDIQLAQDLVGNALTNVWMDAVSLVVIIYFRAPSFDDCQRRLYPGVEQWAHRRSGNARRVVAVGRHLPPTL